MHFPITKDDGIPYISETTPRFFLRNDHFMFSVKRFSLRWEGGRPHHIETDFDHVLKIEKKFKSHFSACLGILSMSTFEKKMNWLRVIGT